MRARLKLWFILLLAWLFLSGVVIGVLGLGLLIEPFFSPNYVDPSIFLGGLLFVGMGVAFTTIILSSSQRIVIDPQSRGLVVLRLLRRNVRWSVGQITGYSVGSEYTRFGSVEAVSIHLVNDRKITFTKRGIRNYAQLKELIATIYPPYEPRMAEQRKRKEFRRSGRPR